MFENLVSALFIQEEPAEAPEELEEITEGAEEQEEETEEPEEAEPEQNAWKSASEMLDEYRAKHGRAPSLLNAKTVRKLSNDEPERGQNAYRVRTEGRTESVHVQDIYTRTAKNGYYNRHSRTKSLIGCGAIAAAVVCTLSGQSIDIQILAYLLACAAVLAFDPGYIFDRILAPQARYMLAFVCVLFAVLPFQKSAQFGKFALIFSGFIILIVKLLNRSWMSAYNWLMSDACQQALNREYGSPHDDRSAAAYWQAFGSRELRTLLFSLGILPTDEEIEVIYKPIFCVGYMANHRTMRRVNDQLDDLEIMRRNYRQLQTELNSVKNDLEKNLEYIDELENENTNLIKQIAGIQSNYQKAREEITRLEAANLDLSGYAINDPEEHREQMGAEQEAPEHEALATVSMKEKRRQHQRAEIIRMYQMTDGAGKKFSFSDIASKVGCSKSHVADVVKAYNRELKEQEEKEFYGASGD